MSEPVSLSAQADVAWCRRELEGAERVDREAAATAAALGQPAPEPLAPTYRRMLAQYERRAVAHSRVTALHDMIATDEEAEE